MSRITQISDGDVQPEAAQLFEAIKSKVGKVPNLYRVAANQPAALSGLLSLGEELGKGSFDAKTREAIALAVAHANNCDYCDAAHTAISKSLRVADVDVEAHRNGRAQDVRTNAILNLSVAIVEKQGFVSNEDLSAARAANLTDSDIIETVANVVANIFTNYLNHVAQTDIDFPVPSQQAA